MNFYGLVMGTVMILAIGLGHVMVIKWEYYWGRRTWPLMLVLGLLLVACSVLSDGVFLSGSLGILGATLLWGVHELFLQEGRVARGLFPRNPQRGG